MDERSICLFHALKGLSARAVDNELIAVLGADAIAYSTVTKSLRQRQFTSILVDRPEKPATAVIDQTILDALEHYPFSSIWELAGLTCIPSTLNTITWLCDEALAPGSSHPHAYSQKRSLPLSQFSSCASFGPPNTTAGSSLSPLTSRGSVFRRTTSRSGFEYKNNPLKDRGIPSKTKAKK